MLKSKEVFLCSFLVLVEVPPDSNGFQTKKTSLFRLVSNNILFKIGSKTPGSKRKRKWIGSKNHLQLLSLAKKQINQHT